jgi:hypothetical protein
LSAGDDVFPFQNNRNGQLLYRGWFTKTHRV